MGSVVTPINIAFSGIFTHYQAKKLWDPCMVSKEGIQVPSESFPKAVDCVLISGYFDTSYFKCC